MRYPAIALLALALLLASCSGRITGSTIRSADARCDMPAPKEIGECGKVFGIYYSTDDNKCHTLNACSVEGEVPFKLSLPNPIDECSRACVKS